MSGAGGLQNRMALGRTESALGLERGRLKRCGNDGRWVGGAGASAAFKGIHGEYRCSGGTTRSETAWGAVRGWVLVVRAVGGRRGQRRARGPARARCRLSAGLCTQNASWVDPRTLCERTGVDAGVIVAAGRWE